jgi:hypothetical protein
VLLDNQDSDPAVAASAAEVEADPVSPTTASTEDDISSPPISANTTPAPAAASSGAKKGDGKAAKKTTQELISAAKEARNTTGAIASYKTRCVLCMMCFHVYVLIVWQ